jgi:hypothetical protein
MEKLEKLRQMIRKIPDGGLITVTAPGYLKYLSCEQLQLVTEICPELTNDYSILGVSDLISRFDLNVDLQLFVIADLMAQMLGKFAKSEADAERRASIIKTMKEKREVREALIAQLESRLEEAIRLREEEVKALQVELETEKNARADLEATFKEKIQKMQQENAKFLEETQANQQMIQTLRTQLKQAKEESEDSKVKQENNDFVFVQRKVEVKHTKFEWWKLLVIGLFGVFLSLFVVVLYKWHVSRRREYN